MRLAVFSDSHGNTENMISAVETCRPGQMIFLGDGVRDAEKVSLRFPDIPTRILQGNCDPFSSPYEKSALIELCGVRIFAAHGHNHGVKYGLDSFCNSVYFSGAQLGLYGHTHRPLWQEFRGLQIMNPGSIGNRLRPTFGLVDLENGKFKCRIMDFQCEISP